MAKDILEQIDQMAKSSVFTGDNVDVAGLGSGAFGAIKRSVQKAKKAVGEKTTEQIKKVAPNIGETIEGRKYQKPVVPKKPVIDPNAQQEIKAQDSANDAKAAEEISSSTQEFSAPSQVVDEASVPNQNTVESAVPVPETQVDINRLMQEEPQVQPEDFASQLQKSKEELGAVQKQISEMPSETQADKEAIRKIKQEELLPPSQVFNLSRYGDLAPALDAISKVSGIETKSISFNDVKAKAIERGFDDKFIEQLVSNNVDVTPEGSMKVLLAEEWSKGQLDELGDKIINGTATTDELLNSVKAISFNSLVLRSVKGYKTNLGQSFGVLGFEAPMGAKFETSIDGLKSQEDLVSFFKKYKAINGNPKAQSEMIDAAATGKKDRLLGAFVSGLTSGTGTLARIVLGDTPRIALRPAETLGAAGVGAIRSVAGLGSSNRAYGQEALSQILSISKGISTGFDAAAYAWKNKVSGLGADETRLEVQIRPDFYDIDPSSNPVWKFALGSFNFASSYGGRSVLTLSEFMKGIHYQMGLEGLATRRGLEAQQLAFDVSKNEDEALAAYRVAVQNTFENPPDDILSEAKYWTLETKPNTDTTIGIVTKKIDEFTSMPNAIGFLTKLKMPFIITPTNDFIQALERTPAKLLYEAGVGIWNGVSGTPKYLKEFSKSLNNTKQKLLDDINSGDYMKRDLALTRIGIGSGVIMLGADMAAEGKITGAGPKNRSEREKWLSQGALPFARVFEIPNGDGLTLQQKEAYAKAKFGEAYNWKLGSGDYSGKLFVSTTGMGTFSILTAMGAIYHENSSYLEDDDLVGAAAAASLGIGDLILDYPALQGLSDSKNFFQNVSDNSEKGWERAIDEIAAWGVKTGSDVLIPASGARRQWVRTIDPTSYEYPVDPDLPTGAAGAVKGYEEMLHGLTFIYGIDEPGEPKRNIFNDIEEPENPLVKTGLRSSAGKANKAMQLFINSGAESRKPKRIFTQDVDMMVDGELRTITTSVQLSRDEYREILKIANAPVELGGFNLKQSILDLQYNDYYMNATAEQKKAQVESSIESSYKGARDALYNGEKEVSVKLRARINKEANDIRLKLVRPREGIE